MKIQTTILIEPIGKARSRHRQLKDGRIIDYTPEPTLTMERIIQYHIRQRVHALGQFEAGVPLKVDIVAYRQRPKHLAKKVLFPITKPDWDNIGKLVTDSLQKYLYWNDAQITDGRVRKRFGDPPRIELTIEEDISGELS